MVKIKLARGILAKPAASIALEKNPESMTDAEIQRELESAIDDSYDDWVEAGRKRTWVVTDNSHVLAIQGDAYETIAKRLRQIAKERGLSIRIGKPIASATTMLYVPILALDKPEPKLRIQPIESFQLTDRDWQLILQSLGFVAEHATNDHVLGEVNRLAARIESGMHNSSANGSTRQLPA